MRGGFADGRRAAGVVGAAACMVCVGRLPGRGGLECSPSGDVIVSETSDASVWGLGASGLAALVFAVSGLTASPDSSELPTSGGGSDDFAAAASVAGIVSAAGVGTESDDVGETAGMALSVAAESVSVAGGVSAAGGTAAADSGCASGTAVTGC